MSVSVTVEEVKLIYPLPRRLSLARLDRRLPRAAPSPSRASFVTALNGVSFSLQPGDRLGLVGANGSGKTTLLKTIYGIFEPTSGRVDVSGQLDAIFNIMLGFRAEATGRRNIVLRGLINGWSLAEIEARTEGIIEFSELRDYIDLPFKTYSQGMAARLAFSAATSFEPEILLLDEWIGAGDPGFQEKARVRMDQLAAKAGIIILASHNHELLRRNCNKILELEKGSVTAFMPAAEWFKGR